MQKLNNALILRRDDYNLLTSYLSDWRGNSAFDRRNAEELRAELKRATLVNKEEFPEDVVRLNSIVKIRSEDKGEIMELKIVTPNKANIKENKISIMAPIGTALIGFRKGESKMDSSVREENVYYIGRDKPISLSK